MACWSTGARGGAWEQVLVNKQFSLPETKISDADVIAIVSASLGLNGAERGGHQFRSRPSDNHGQ